MSATPQEKARMLEAEKLNLQLEGLERRLQALARQRAEAKELLGTLDALPSVADGDELLVPVATGLFTRARAVAGSTLIVNVGDGVAVEKPVGDVRAMVQDQVRRLDAQEEQLQEQFEAGLVRLTELRESFEAKDA